jgi:EF hand
MKVLAVTAVLMLVSGLAHAQAPSLDPAGDGPVSLDAFIKAENDAMLGRLDADGDGRISKAEMKPVADRAPEGSDREGRLERMWARSDLNGDGFIDRAELDAGAKQRFERRDANKDGWLTGDELPGQGRVRGRP